MIFISYRVEDSRDDVEHLDTRFAAVFGREAVFRDKKQLTGGDQWRVVLEEQATACKVMLVVIGAKWQTAAYTDDARLGQLRLDDPADWVRQEITLALDHGATVIPVLLKGQRMPHRDWLTARGLARFAECQGVKLRTDEYDADFASLVASVRKHLPSLPPSPPPLAPLPPPRVWKTEVRYALQPAPHFAGRSELLRELAAWAVAPNDPVRVRALVAAGGTGKTAVAEKVLAGLPDENPFGVFVWSFYENPQTEAFLRAACEYFLGEAPKDTGGLLEHLQRGLRAADLPHLLILDGLELVQAAGTTGRPRGELEDPLMKRFLRWLAAGRGTRAKALITSRFPLPDLADWGQTGFRPCDLEDLDPLAARSVFRRRGVRATDAELDALAANVHGHALTVDVLGLYLVRFADGDPRNAEPFDLKAFGAHQKAERLSKVLTSYAEKLPNEERDLLARLSLFPRGVTVEWLNVVIAEGGATAGALAGCSSSYLLNVLEGLREIGLVFASDTRDGRTFSAHPFLRDFFRGLMGATKPEQVHEAVRKHVARGLEERPERCPIDSATLDRYERLIEVTRLAGHREAAFELYWAALGGYKHLGQIIGDFGRGLRIVSGFSDVGVADEHQPAGSQRDILLAGWGLYAQNLGDTPTARHVFTLQERLHREHSDGIALSRCHRNFAYLELLAGRWAVALDLAHSALKNASLEDFLRYSHGHLAAAFVGLGELTAARNNFHRATTRSDDLQMWCMRAIHEVELTMRTTADRPRGVTLADECLQLAARTGRSRSVASCHCLLGHCSMPHDPPKAEMHLTQARAYASRTGNVEVALRCYHLAAEIARHENDHHLAEAEALDGVQLADSCGFGRWSLDLRTELAKIHLAAGEPKRAIEPAEWVLKRSQEPDCQYAWGIADSLHLLGVAYSRLGDNEKAREHLSRAIEKRRSIEHPGLSETEGELNRVE